MLKTHIIVLITISIVIGKTLGVITHKIVFDYNIHCFYSNYWLFSFQ